MEPQHFLRIEGLMICAVTLGGYFTLEGPLWLLAVLALAPDVSMVGYLAGPRVGSRCYNLVHTYTLPLLLGTVGFLLDSQLAVLTAFVWAGHIGIDRFVGFGLKFESGFDHTHLSKTMTAAGDARQP